MKSLALGPPVNLAELRSAVAPSELVVLDRPRLTGDGYASAAVYRPGLAAEISRALIVDWATNPDDEFLRRAAETCRQLRTEVVVLTVAGSDRSAVRRQRQARAALSGNGAAALFDCLIGANGCEAVAHVVRWRHCQLVVTRRATNPWWRRWLHPRGEARLPGPVGPAGVLILPSFRNRQPSEVTT